MSVTDISPLRLAAGYGLLIIPLGILLWYKVPVWQRALLAVVRMTVQLLFVGMYLEVVFKLNNPWINGAWLLVMILVADISIARDSNLKLGRIWSPLFIALLSGTALPLLVFLAVILKRPNLMEAQYVIPIGGMILGNCLRSDIIGINSFYDAVRKSEKRFLYTLSQGAELAEAIQPFLRQALQSALAPTIATISTIGLVSLPGMMTGVILGGTDPMTAIKYQIAIMIAIFTGSSITVLLAIRLTSRIAFNEYGVLDRNIFKSE